MYDQSVWVREGKTSCSHQQQEEDARFLWNVSQGIELQYTDTTSKRKQMRKAKENLSFLLSRIEPSPL